MGTLGTLPPIKPRLKLPAEAPKTVAEHLHALSLSNQRASAWWQVEVKKLIPIALNQERMVGFSFMLGVLAGAVVTGVGVWLIS